MNPLEVQGARKAFGAKQALRGATMRVEPGELVGLVGPNGAGKTTLLRILLGIVARDGGDVRVLGMDPRRDSLRIRAHCSYLPGETSVYHGMRGSEFLHFALSFYPNLQSDVQARLLEVFGLPLTQKVHGYSAGMKQKLALMATLIPDVEFYILDEPDRALDATTRFALRDLLGQLRAKGKTILLSSHHLREVEALADRLVFLLDGETVDEARVESARATLRRRIRLQLSSENALPDGARVLGRTSDGKFDVEPEGPPLSWLAQIPENDLIAAEVGTVRLEDLYRMLTEGAAP